MKNAKKILALLLALVMMLTLFVGCGEKAAKEAHDHDHEAEVEQAPAEKVTGHHVNAHGLESFSIHYTDSADGQTFDYMNEAGELVSVSQEEVDALMQTVVATCGDLSLTNRELGYCYQDQYYQFYQAYGMYMMLMMDSSKGLDEQVGADGTNTWQYMFVDAATSMFHRLAAVKQEAEANDFDLSVAEKAVEDNNKSLEDSAAQLGYSDLDKFAADYFGPGATMDSYVEFSRMQAIFNSYTTMLQEQVEVSEDMIDAYWKENEQTLTDGGLQKIDKNVVDVRHILVKPEETTAEDGTTSISDEAWAAAEAKANSIYEQWVADGATEEAFIELVGAHTEDPGSAQTGGLYEDVYPGQMVEAFDAWCYEDGREVGDHGVVKTDYGYHIMYFAGEGDYVYWRKTVKDRIIAEEVNKMLEAIEEKYPMELDLTKVVVLDSTAPTIPSEEEETAAELPVEEHVHTEDDGHNH